MKRRMRYRGVRSGTALLTAVALLLTIATVACGSPDADRKFEFTPVPYVTVEEDGFGIVPLALAPGSPTYRDPVEVTAVVWDPTPRISIIDVDGKPRMLPLALTDNRQIYRVDEVGVSVAIDEAESFIEWAEEWGFTGKERFRVQTDEFVFLVLEVPPGSAPDALTLIRTNGSVDDAWLSHFDRLAGLSAFGA